VIVITTGSRESKLCRWLRYYHGWFKSVTPNWVETTELSKIDKIRVLTYNCIEKLEPHPECINTEFSDLVSGKFVVDNNLNYELYEYWKSRNAYLYPIDHESWAVQRFVEAEYEILHNPPYNYFL